LKKTGSRKYIPNSRETPEGSPLRKMGTNYEEATILFSRALWYILSSRNLKNKSREKKKTAEVTKEPNA